MSKLTFNITEIPEGESQRSLSLMADDLDMSPHDFKGGDIVINFYRARHFIRATYEVEADVELICDRSLEPFIQIFSTSYDVIFKAEVEQETEDEEGAVRRFDFSSNTFSIEKEVRDSLMLQIPMQNIHPKFLDENGNINDFETQSFGADTSSKEQQQVDPRWKKLKQLKDNK